MNDTSTHYLFVWLDKVVGGLDVSVAYYFRDCLCWNVAENLVLYMLLGNALLRLHGFYLHCLGTKGSVAEKDGSRCIFLSIICC